MALFTRIPPLASSERAPLLMLSALLRRWASSPSTRIP
jgi:hypothetical protein